MVKTFSDQCADAWQLFCEERSTQVEQLTEPLRKTYHADVDQILEQVVKDRIKKAARMYLTKMLDDDMESAKKKFPGLAFAIDRFGEDNFKSESRGRPKKHLDYRLFVTLQSRNDKDVNPIQFWAQMQKLVKKMSLQGTGRFKLEQRSEGDQDPYGWHIHWDLLLDRPISMSVFFQQVAQCMAKYMLFPRVEGKVDYRNIDIKAYGDHHDKYMMGQKVPEKMPKVEKDILLRKRYGIPDIFSY